MTTHPSLQRIKELLLVDTEAGTISWRRSQGRAKAGSPAGRVTVKGYSEICIDGRAVFAHAIVWLVATGDWPTRIDHMNGMRTDNRFANLRLCDAATNARNRTNWVHRKLLGAHPRPDGKFSAVITADGVPRFLGVFDTEVEAHARYCIARDLCASAEKLARQQVLDSLTSAPHGERARLTVLEEIQAGRAAA